jgi:hypothetical protein
MPCAWQRSIVSAVSCLRQQYEVGQQTHDMVKAGSQGVKQ